VVRLLRILRGGALPATGFERWTVRDGGRLVTPAGVEFRAGDFEWWALTCLQARSWQRRFDLEAAARPSAGGTRRVDSTVADGGALDSGARAKPGADAAGDAERAPCPSLPSGEPAFASLACRAQASHAATHVDAPDACEPLPRTLWSVSLTVCGAMPASIAVRSVPSANRGLKVESDASMASYPHRNLGFSPALLEERGSSSNTSQKGGAHV
jgi:hypothetical protein